MFSRKFSASHENENISQLEGAIKFIFDKYKYHPDLDQIKRLCVNKAIGLFKNGIKEYVALIENIEKEIWKNFYD